MSTDPAFIGALAVLLFAAAFALLATAMAPAGRRRRPEEEETGEDTQPFGLDGALQARIAPPPAPPPPRWDEPTPVVAPPPSLPGPLPFLQPPPPPAPGGFVSKERFEAPPPPPAGAPELPSATSATPAGSTLSPLRRRLAQAGLDEARDAAWFFGAQIACALLLPLGVLAAVQPLGLPRLGADLFAVGGALLGFGLPRWLLESRAADRRARIRRALPDLLDLVTASIEGGLGLQAALLRATAELEGYAPDLSREMTRTLHRWTAGSGRRDALLGLIDRTGVRELGELMHAIDEAARRGSSLPESLRRLAEHLRLEEAARVRTWAQTVTIRVALAQAVFLLPAVVILLLGPAILRAVRTLDAF